jgi:hypothetical protein
MAGAGRGYDNLGRLRMQPDHKMLVRAAGIETHAGIDEGACSGRGVAVSLYLVYAAFFSALWSAPFRTGRSIVIACLALLALELAAAIWMRVFRRGLLSVSAPGPVNVR